jgi:DNA-binding MarR family transcriptional regulator
VGPLDAYLPYLLNRAGARIAASFSEEVRPFGATLQMWRVLAALRERDGRRMGDLSETTSIEVSTLTRLIDSMEGKGLVVRRRSAEDARAVDGVQPALVGLASQVDLHGSASAS